MKNSPVPSLLVEDASAGVSEPDETANQQWSRFLSPDRIQNVAESPTTSEVLGGTSASPSNSYKLYTNDTSPRSASDLAEVKATATRLNLSTRRSSYTEWLHFYLGKRLSCPQFPLDWREKDGRLTTERKQRIDRALEWLRGELLAMRRQDQALARQLLSLRQDIQHLKLRRTSLQHQAMLDDLSSQLEELEQLPEPLDLPAESLSDPRLQQLGVTRMNLSQRRFSTS